MGFSFGRRDERRRTFGRFSLEQERLPLTFAAAVTIVVEGTLREGLVGRSYQIAVGLILVCAFWVRRERPLLAVAIAFGTATLSTLASQVLPSPHVALYTTAIVLLLPYSLARWGSGRAVLVGLLVIASTYAASAIHGEMPNAPDYVGGAVTMLFPMALGTAVRFRAAAHRRAVEHAKLLERAQIARDLHDTVAHHVSAIAIQAQAGRAVFASQPDAALRTLGTIEA